MKFEYKKIAFDIKGIMQDDWIYKSIITTRCFYEIDLLEYMYSINSYMRKKDSVAIDVGANIGNHSIFFRTFLADHLIAIEPNPAVLPILGSNLEQNIKDYSIIDYALGEAEGSGKLVFPEGSTDNVGMAQIDTNGDGHSIKITTLDSIVAEWEKSHNITANVALIKIDVEGMEVSVLKGAVNTLSKHRPHLFIEAATTEKYQELESYLDAFGYRTLSCWAATPVYHFSHTPSIALVTAVRLAEFFRFAKTMKAKLRAKLKRLTTLS